MSVTIVLDKELEKGEEAFLRLPKMTQEEFYAFCERNPLLNIERNADGDIVLMSPADTYGGTRNSELIIDIGIWNRSLSTPGLVADSSAGFTLPNGAERSPDASWIPMEQWNAIPISQRRPFAHTVPPFVVELMSPTDRLKRAQEKMEEYIANGVLLGWLIDRTNRKVYVYHPNQDAEVLDNPTVVAGDPELPGLTVNMTRIFEDA